MSIIDDNGCLRKGNKSVLVQQLGIPVCNPQPPDVVIVDASQLIYHVVWPSSGTVADLAASMGHRLSCYNTQTFVIFVKYLQMSAKDHRVQALIDYTSTYSRQSFEKQGQQAKAEQTPVYFQCRK